MEPTVDDAVAIVPSGVSPAGVPEMPNPPSPTYESGLGHLSVLPENLRGWNWGAFFFTWIWGLGNGVYVALWGLLLCMVPLGGLVWAIVCGSKGNEWAWKTKKWQSHEEFRRVQWRWTLAAPIVLGVVFALWAILAVLGAMGSA